MLSLSLNMTRLACRRTHFDNKYGSPTMETEWRRSPSPPLHGPGPGAVLQPRRDFGRAFSQPPSLHGPGPEAVLQPPA